MGKSGDDSASRLAGLRRLQSEGIEGWTDGERALLLALATLDVESGEHLGDEDRAALEALAAQIDGYDATELAQAVRHMVNAPARRGEKMAWSELDRKRAKHRKEQ